MDMNDRMATFGISIISLRFHFAPTINSQNKATRLDRYTKFNFFLFHCNQFSVVLMTDLTASVNFVAHRIGWIHCL